MLAADPRPDLRFSIIIPLEFHRGQADTCLKSWLEGQTFARDRFEVIVACPQDFPESEAAPLRAQLAPQDRFLLLPGDHDMTLCEAAAREAVGEILFFTESHVYPEANVLEIVDRAVTAHPEWAGFSCHSIPITHNLLSQIEAELYDRDIQHAMNEHPWRKVLDQCFAIRREPYFEAGEFEAQYGHFAEWLLSARLYQLGYRVGFVPEARLNHYYIGEMGDWMEFTEDFGEGQMRYLAKSLETPGPEFPLLDDVPEWTDRHQYVRRTAFQILSMIAQSLIGRRDSSVSPGQLLPSLWRWSVFWALGPWQLIIPAWLQWKRQERKLRKHLRSGDRAGALRAYQQCWGHLITLQRGQFLRRWAKQAHRTGRLEVAESGHVLAPQGVGFYQGEVAGEDSLRWSEPAAFLELPLDLGKYRLKLRLMNLPQNASAQFYFDGKQIPETSLKRKWDGVEIQVRTLAAGRHRLGWVCPPVQAPPDTRALGLPVYSLEWRCKKSVAPELPADSLFFLHIRKTAGVSLRDAIINRFPAQGAEPFFLAHTPANVDRDPNLHPFITGHVHFGYVEKLQSRPVIFTMLRDPVERALSAYYFFRGHDEAKLGELKEELTAEAFAERLEFLTKSRERSASEFLEREPELARLHLSDIQTRALLSTPVTGELSDSHLAEALANLEACDVIGLLERLPESIALLEHRMGWEDLGPIPHHNATRERLSQEEVDPVVRDILTSWNQRDLQLYQRAQELFAARLEGMRKGTGAVAGRGARKLPSATDFTPAQPIHGRNWSRRELVNDRWICWMGAETRAWLDLAVSSYSDGQLTCEFPQAISPLALELLQIQVNGSPVEHQRSGPHGEIFTCQVPAAYLRRSPDHVRLTFICRERQRPRDIDLAIGDQRLLSVALGRVRLVSTIGEEAGTAKASLGTPNPETAL